MSYIDDPHDEPMKKYRRHANTNSQPPMPRWQ